MKRVAITVYKRRGNSWDRYIFKNAYVTVKDAIKREGGGTLKGGSMTARIFSSGAELVAAGDRVTVGIGPKMIPESTLLISEVKNNYAISRRHIRITAV